MSNVIERLRGERRGAVITPGGFASRERAPNVEPVGTHLEDVEAAPGRGLSGYPTELERTVHLRDGSSVRLRPVRPEDAVALGAFFRRLGRRSLYQRFFSPVREIPATWIQRFTHVDYRARLTLVAEAPGGGELIGLVSYVPTDDDPAAHEISALVDDGWQGRGLGTIMVDQLLRAAEERGVHCFRADVLAENRRVLNALARGTEVRSRRSSDGVTTVSFRRRGASVA